jgi:pimeloyl-ACP methyl ester carboxylesterase
MITDANTQLERVRGCGQFGTRGRRCDDEAERQRSLEPAPDKSAVHEFLRRPGGPALLVSPMPVDHDLKRAMPVLWAFDSREWLIDVRTPTLVIAGTADLVVPGHRVREVHERIRGSTLVMVEGGGHVPSAERRPGAVTAVRRFVAARAREPVNG